MEYQSNILTTLPVHPLMHVFPLPDRDVNSSVLTYQRMCNSVDATSIKKFWFTQAFILHCLHGSKIPATAFAWIWNAGRAIQAWCEKRARRRKLLPRAHCAGSSAGCAVEEGGGQHVTGLALDQAAMLSRMLSSWSCGLQTTWWSTPQLTEVKRSQWGCNDFRTGWLVLPSMNLKGSCTQILELHCI